MAARRKTLAAKAHRRTYALRTDARALGIFVGRTPAVCGLRPVRDAGKLFVLRKLRIAESAPAPPRLARADENRPPLKFFPLASPKRGAVRGEELPIAFCAVVRLAQHLAVFNICPAAFAPRSHMVGIHVFEIPNFGFVCIMPNGAMRAI